MFCSRYVLIPPVSSAVCGELSKVSHTEVVSCDRVVLKPLIFNTCHRVANTLITLRLSVQMANTKSEKWEPVEDLRKLFKAQPKTEMFGQPEVGKIRLPFEETDGRKASWLKIIKGFEAQAKDDCWLTRTPSSRSRLHLTG